MSNISDERQEGARRRRCGGCGHNLPVCGMSTPTLCQVCASLIRRARRGEKLFGRKGWWRERGLATLVSASLGKPPSTRLAEVNELLPGCLDISPGKFRALLAAVRAGSRARIACCKAQVDERLVRRLCENDSAIRNTWLASLREGSDTRLADRVSAQHPAWLYRMRAPANYVRLSPRQKRIVVRLLRREREAGKRLRGAELRWRRMQKAGR